jgi:hypothetical protein
LQEKVELVDCRHTAIDDGSGPRVAVAVGMSGVGRIESGMVTFTTDDNGELGVVLALCRVEFPERSLDRREFFRNDDIELALQYFVRMTVELDLNEHHLGDAISIDEYSFGQLAIVALSECRQTLHHHVREIGDHLEMCQLYGSLGGESHPDKYLLLRLLYLHASWILSKVTVGAGDYGCYRRLPNV